MKNKYRLGLVNFASPSSLKNNKNKIINMKFQPPKGTRDFLPEEMFRRNIVSNKIRKIFENYGYGEICTPAFEDFDLLSKKSGPDIENEIYAFKDKSDRKLGLRFDPTVPICRIVSSDASLKQPIKFFYVTNMWRYDQPGKARWREFWQAGLELIGTKRPESDAEILSIVYESLKSVGIKKFYFKINSRSIVESLIKEAGIEEKNKLDVFRAIDKLAKIGERGVVDELAKSNIPKKSIDKLLDLIKSTKKLKELDELENIKMLAEKMGVDNIKIDFSIVRGIDYYTGFVFETFVEGKEDIGSVASGGRYDTLVKLYGGQDLPAVGFGIGIDRIMDVVELEEKYFPVDLYVATVDDSVKKDVLEIVQKIRRKGIGVDMDLMGRNLKKQLEYINAIKIPFCIVVGKNEIQSKKFKLKDMDRKSEKDLNVEGIIKELKEK
jgi:histidyl-tRNA synthetase